MEERCSSVPGMFMPYLNVLDPSIFIPIMT